ncbi:hypothetical protein D3C74_369380 [compost metagenome]
MKTLASAHLFKAGQSLFQSFLQNSLPFVLLLFGNGTCPIRMNHNVRQPKHIHNTWFALHSILGLQLLYSLQIGPDRLFIQNSGKSLVFLFFFHYININPPTLQAALYDLSQTIFIIRPLSRQTHHHFAITMID